MIAFLHELNVARFSKTSNKTINATIQAGALLVAAQLAVVGCTSLGDSRYSDSPLMKRPSGGSNRDPEVVLKWHSGKDRRRFFLSGDDSQHDLSECLANPVRGAVRKFGGIYINFNWSPRPSSPRRAWETSRRCNTFRFAFSRSQCSTIEQAQA